MGRLLAPRDFKRSWNIVICGRISSYAGPIATAAGVHTGHATALLPAAGNVKVGMLTNPFSGGNRKGLGAAAEALAQHPEVCHREIQNPSDVRAVLDDFAREGVELIVINGGDGTVQAVLTVLLLQKPFEKPPFLSLLRAGTASMTARDVGLRGSRAGALRRLFRWARTGDREAMVVPRPVLRVQPGQDREPLYGMFFGAGAIYRGIEYFHRRIHGLGLRGEVSSGLTLARILFAVFLRHRDLVAPIPVNIALDGMAPVGQSCLVLLISTLERLIVGLRPFFGVGNGALHYTAVGAHPKHLIRVMPYLLWGRNCRHGIPENGYFSHNVDEVRLALDTGFTLDGELYDPASHGEPVVVQDGGSVSFVRV